MAVPKSKISRSKRGMRRSHDALKTKNNHKMCSETGELHRRGNCYNADGKMYYKGEPVESIVPEDGEA